jgi:Copper binding periplasmic protein CusF
MKTLVIVALSLLLVGGLMVVPSQPGGPLSVTDPVFTKFIGGTIEEIDHAGLRVTIQTEQGSKESLTVADASLLQGLSKGDRVSVEMDEQGKARTIVKTMPNRKGAPEPGS